MSAYRTVYVKQ